MKKTINTDKAPKAIGPYNQAVIAEKMVFTSGQIPIDPATEEFVKGDIKLQTHQVMKNLQSVLKACGTDFSNVVKTTIYLNDINNFNQVNKVYATYFSSDKQQPSRSVVQAAALPKGAKIEIDMIAVIS